MGLISNVPGSLDVSVTGYTSPDGRQVPLASTLAILFSDDFGGAALDTTVRWDVFDGGLGLNPTLRNKTLAQGAIGSGTAMGNGVNGAANTALSVASSALSIAMGTTSGAELWILSQQAFAGTEDMLVLIQKSQSLAANSCWIGLVEADPITLIPLLNPNQAGFFTNMAGVEICQATSSTGYYLTAIGDSSPTQATGSTGRTVTGMTGVTQELWTAFHAEDVVCSSALIDSPGARGSLPSRVSSQVPNDGRVYKLLIRLRNTATPVSSTTIAIARIALIDSQEMSVDIRSGPGDNCGQNALGVNVVSSTQNSYKLLSAATTNGTVIKTLAGVLMGGAAFNFAASARYLKIYNASSVTVGTTVPVLTIPLPAGTSTNPTTTSLANILSMFGLALSAGISIAITGGIADNDTTAIGAGDVQLDLVYN